MKTEIQARKDGKTESPQDFRLSDFPTSHLKTNNDQPTTTNHHRTMKPSTILLLTSCVLLLATATHAQTTIRRVNNNPGVTGVNVYTTAQAAHDAAVPNDILIIEPSVTTYGNLTLTKPLKIYGNGYFLSTNTELKADQRNSILANLDFNAGSGGSEISGIYFTNSVTVNGISNLIIQRCYFDVPLSINSFTGIGTVYNNVTNILVSGNYSPGAIIGSAAGSKTISNVLVTNNIVQSINANSPDIQNWIVRNNTIHTNPGGLTNGIFENNLLTLSNGGAPAFINCTVSNNVSRVASFSSGFGNQNNFSIAPELITAGAGISPDEAYQIKAGSPLKTAGSGGTEVGAFGGATPYVVSGIPAIPSIVNMSNTATGSNTVPLSVTISVKGNN
jgi:hypothetical protein